MRGSIVSFDRVKGYGFLAPEDGGEDVFVHVNDLLDDKSLMVPGRTVEFIMEDGDRGPKASEVTVTSQVGGSSSAGSARSRQQLDNDDMCDVLSAQELEHELTEALLHTDPPLTGKQILDVRKRVTTLAQNHGWVDR